MLRLWPKTYYAGLFAERGWLACGSGRRRRVFAQRQFERSVSMAARLERLLVQAPDLEKGARLVVTVPDSLAQCIAVPWSAGLSSPEERIEFGQACFERAGLTAQGWCMHVEFRHYRAMGLAYAIPQRELESLLDAATARLLTVRNVMPVSALAHQALGRTGGSLRRLRLLSEADRLTILASDHLGLSGVDAEPVIGSAEQALARLLKRGAPGDYDHVEIWSPFDDVEWLAKSVESLVKPAVIRCLPWSYWERRQ